VRNERDKQKRLHIIRTLKQELELRECTFQPKLHTRYEPIPVKDSLLNEFQQSKGDPLCNVMKRQITMRRRPSVTLAYIPNKWGSTLQMMPKQHTFAEKESPDLEESQYKEDLRAS
jgi:hypothetical protein